LSQPHVSTADQADLIGFLQGLPEGRKRRGIRYPQWFLLMAAILGILSGCLSAKDLERFAARHHGALNAVLGLGIKGSPTDSTFLYLLSGWISPSCSPCSRAGCWSGSLLREGKSLNWSAAARPCDTGESNDRQALRELLSTMDTRGVLIQTDALHTTKAFFQLATEQGADVLMAGKP
jgi:hypothetical protein